MWDVLVDKNRKRSRDGGKNVVVIVLQKTSGVLYFNFCIKLHRAAVLSIICISITNYTVTIITLCYVIRPFWCPSNVLISFSRDTVMLFINWFYYTIES